LPGKIRPVSGRRFRLNYTSGTTGNPKGVVYHHRGAYLNAVSNAMVWDMGLHPVYLWTLPMFHCNGWCFPWTIAATVGTNVCLRQVRADLVFDLIKTGKGQSLLRRADCAELAQERPG
jgi:fatty-acyl-CoA synthase